MQRNRIRITERWQYSIAGTRRRWSFRKWISGENRKQIKAKRAAGIKIRDRQLNAGRERQTVPQKSQTSKAAKEAAVSTESWINWTDLKFDGFAGRQNKQPDNKAQKQHPAWCRESPGGKQTRMTGKWKPYRWSKSQVPEAENLITIKDIRNLGAVFSKRRQLFYFYFNYYFVFLLY